MSILDNSFTIQSNEFLSIEVKAYFHTNFYGYGKQNNPNYLNTLKNDKHQCWSSSKLMSATNQLKTVLLNELPQIFHIENTFFTVCIVPRSKADNTYNLDQLLFKSTVKEVLNQLNYTDGTDYIKRCINTKTTHLRNPIQGFNNDGLDPYPGISKETCDFSPDIKGANILLIDDIYTKTVNIDEDMIQALLDNGANSVTFYAIGNTVSKF